MPIVSEALAVLDVVANEEDEDMDDAGEVIEDGFAAFVVEGEFLTETARRMLMSECVSQAWRLLANHVHGANPGDSEVMARQVLDGTHKLVGDTEKGIRLVKDRSFKKIQKSTKYIFAGRVRIDNAWYRPSARVTLLGADDAAFALDRNPALDDMDPTSYEVRNGAVEMLAADIKRWKRDRIAYFARKGEIVVPIPRKNEFDEPEYMLFEPCSEPPFWWSELQSPTAALADFLATGRKLHEREADMPTKAQVYGKNSPEAAEPSAREMIEARQALREAARAIEIARIRTEVKKQAGDDVFELVIDDPGDPNAENWTTGEQGRAPSERTLRIPRAPFWHWAFARTAIRHLAPPWQVVSPVGMKLDLDDPYHTDWLLGADLELDGFYRSVAHDVAWAYAFDLISSMTNYTALVFSKGPDVVGVVGVDVLVLANLHPSQLTEVLAARAVITEVGGELAHLAIMSREHAVPMVLVKNARTKFPTGTRVRVCTDPGSVDIETSQEEHDESMQIIAKSRKRREGT